MGSPFDFLSGLQKGAEQLGSALGNFVSQAPSKPMPSPHAALPQPQNQPQPQAPSQPNAPATDYGANWQKLGSSLGDAVTKTAKSAWDGSGSSAGAGYDLGRNLLDSPFAKDMGINKLANNAITLDKKNPDTLTGQIAAQEADPNSPLRQLRKPAWQKGPSPLEGANKWVNENVMAPIQAQANPQFWFDDHMDPSYMKGDPQAINTFIQDVTGNKGHNYLRDMFGPIVKKITGEDVPPVPSTYTETSQALVEENNRLKEAAASLNPQSSPEDIAAFNSALEQHNAKAQAQMDAYDKSANWWANSNTAKTLSVLGQLATMPASFAASAVTFPLAIMTDPIGTGEMTIDQVVQGINFVNTLQDQDKRANMTSDELGANINNIVMLGGLMFGAKKAVGTTAKGLTSVKRSMLGTRPEQSILDDIQTKLQATTPELHSPASAPQVDAPPVSLLTHSPEQVAAYRAQQDGKLNGLRSTMQAETDINKKAVLLKQINDIQDERKAMDSIKAPAPQQNLPPRLKEQYDSVRDSVRGGGGFNEDPRVVQSLSNDDLVSLAGEAEARHDMAMLDALDHETERRGGWDAIKGEGVAELQKQIENGTFKPTLGELRDYHDTTGLPEGQVRSIPRGTEDFTRPDVQAEAQARRPEDYTTPNVEVPAGPKRELTPEEQAHMDLFKKYQESGKTDQVRSSVEADTKARFARERKLAFDEGQRTEDFPGAVAPAGPTTKFEELSPKTIEAKARTEGFNVVPLNKMSGNAWIMRDGKAINIGGAFDPYANHDLFIRSMKLPGDTRKADANGEHNQTKMDMMRAGMIRVSDFDQFINFGVDRFDHENLPMIEEAIRNDMAKGGRKRPYIIDQWDTGEHFTIDPQELLANGDLANLITQVRRLQRATSPRSELPVGPTPPRIFKEAVDEAGWKLMPNNKVDYGWLFPGGKGADIGMSKDGRETSIRGQHKDLWQGLSEAIGRPITPKEYQNLTANAVQLRRGYKQDINDHYFYTEKWTPETLKIVQDYLQDKTTRPANIVLESRAGTAKDATEKGMGSNADYSFNYDEFKNNDFKLEGLNTNRVFNPRTEVPGGSQGMGPRLWDQFRHLRTAEGRIAMLEGRIEDYTVKGLSEGVIRKTGADLSDTLKEVQRQLADLPSELPAHLSEIRDRLQEKLNEKGYPAIDATGTEGAAGTSGEGLNKTPAGAEGTTLTSVVPGPQGEGQVAFWSPDAKSTGSVSPRERGQLALAQQLGKDVQQVLNLKREPEDIRFLELNSKNIARRTNEYIETIKANVDGLDPMGVATVKNVVFDPNLTTEALYEPTTGMIKINPTRSIPITWLRGVSGRIQDSIINLKGLVPEQGMRALHEWYDEIKNMTQAQLDWSIVAEEILHKYDRDHLSSKGYLEALNRLPAEWWDHARRSGIGDVFQEGITATNPFAKEGTNSEFTLKDANGTPVRSWKTAFDLARLDGPFGGLDEKSFSATMHAFMEYRVTQLRNYHGIPGTKFTYRVPEVITREVENPDLIKEGAQLAGNDFERYVQAETAYGLADHKSFEEEAAANDASRNAESATGIPGTATAGVSGRNATDQAHVVTPEGPQDWPQVGDILEVNQNTRQEGAEPFIPTKEPNWKPVTNRPIRDADDIRRATQIVSSRGVGPIYSQPKFAQDFRVVNPRTGQVRAFKGEMPAAANQEFNLTGWNDVKETPQTFHSLPTPEIPQVDLNARPVQGKINEAGFSRKTLRLSETDPTSVPVPHGIGAGYTEAARDSEGKPIAQSLKYRPLIALRETGYPGSWVDFLKAMAGETDAPAYQKARPYWDALDLKYKRAFMETMQEPEVIKTIINAEVSPDAVTPDEMQSPSFKARQDKIRQFQDDVSKSGPILDKLAKTVNTKEGLLKYAQEKGMVAMKAKFASLSPSIPELEAMQLAKAEFTRVSEEIANKPTDAAARRPRDSQVEAMSSPGASLAKELTPVMRDTLTMLVTKKQAGTNKVAEGHYKSLGAFLDAYAVREEGAVKIYSKLKGMSKDAVKNIVAQYPQSFQMGRNRPDQTLIPTSMQENPLHINPVNPDQLRAIAQGSVNAIVRSGSTDYIERGLEQGQASDKETRSGSKFGSALTSLGRLQARNLARAFRGHNRLKIVTSDMKHDQETADTIAKIGLGSKVTYDPNLRPWNMGHELTGISEENAAPHIKKLIQETPDAVPAGGESWNQFKARFLPAIKQHLGEKNVIVTSGREQRLAEGWIAKDMPNDLSVDEGALVNPRGIGPGGIMDIGNKPDGNYVVNHKVSQAPSDVEAMATPRVPPSSVPLRDENKTVNMSNRPPREPYRAPAPARPEPEGVSPQARYNFQVGDKANGEVAKAKGELAPAMPQDRMDHIDSIVADKSIDPTNPLKVAAIRVQMARQGVEAARQYQVPVEVVNEQVHELSKAIDVASQLIADKAKEDVAVAKLAAPPRRNQMTFDTSLIKAKEHQNRMMQGEDYTVSAYKVAKDMIPGENPLGKMIGTLKDGAAGILPPDHMYHSLSPAFKDIFVDPKAIETVRQANAEEAARQQGVLPFSQAELAGVDIPAKPLPQGPEQARKAAAARKAQPNTPQRSSVTPASADAIRAVNPSPDPPVEESIPDMQKRYTFELNRAMQMSTKELRNETDQLHEAINMEYPNILDNGLEDINLEDVPQDVHQAEDQVHQTNANGASGGGKGGDGGQFRPLDGWDDKRDFLTSFDGEFQKLGMYGDRIVKAETKLVDASSQHASVQGMVQAHVYYKLALDNMRRDFVKTLNGLYPAKMNEDRTFANPDEQAKHEAMAKAIGGDETERQKNLKALSPQDQAVAEMINQYHKVLGRLGVRPETHLWDEAQENYFRRQVLLDDQGNVPSKGGVFSKKMSIAFERRKREVNEVTEDGRTVTTKENYYADSQALEDAGFKVEKNFVTLIDNHLNQFSNMSITHQLIQDFSKLESYAESNPKRGQTPWVGPLLVKRMSLNPSTKQMEPALIAKDYWNQKQVRTVERGPFRTALRDYHVYYKLADVLERLAGRSEDTNPVDKLANIAAYANVLYKTGHFAFNPVHAYNLWSNIYAMGTHGLLDAATWYPGLLQQRIFGDIHELMQEKGSWPDWDGTPINGSDFVNRAIGWGATPESDITGSADLGGIHDYIKRHVPAYAGYDKWMWHDLAWVAQLGLIKHSMEVSQKVFTKKMGRPMNEAEFNNAGFISTQRAREAMGFIDKTEMSHGWQVYARALYMASSWSTAQLRLAFGAMPQGIPGVNYMANIGGANRGSKTVSAKMASHGGMDQKGLDVINGMRGQQARRMMIGGAAKLIAMSTILSYAGSYYFTGQAQGPIQNAQKDLTHVFDIWGGIDPVTKKDIWYHNPLFGMQQEMMLYPIEGIKALQNGKNPWEAMQAMGGRYMGKEQPFLRTATDMAAGRNMSLWLKGWGDQSAIDQDPQVIAVRRAIDATGMNPFPESLSNNLIYAVRSAFPFTPGFPDRLDTSNGTNPAETNATLGNTLNALGPGKFFSIGDWINAVQGVPGAGFDTLPGTIAQNSGFFALGSREAQSSTPQQAAQSNQIGEAKVVSDARNQALKDIAHAAATGDWKTVNEITQQFNLSTAQMTSAVLHPPPGGGQGILYKGLPPRTNYTPPRQEALLGQELSVDDTAHLELIRNANIMATIDRVANMQTFQAKNDTTRSADMVAYINLVTTMTNDQFAQTKGLLGGTPITDADISGAVGTAIQFRSTASDVLQHTSLYQQADPIERQRMETHYGTFATTLAREAYVGNLKGVPLENIQNIISMTINNTEAARSYLTTSMFYQLAQPYDQTRMMNEYTTLAETMSRREALGQGQGGTYDAQLTPEQIIPTIQFIINTEETGKAQLHITDFYNASDQPTQTALDHKYETLARGLAFSNNSADPRELIANSLNADQSYYDLQNQFGGANYLKTMADELASLQRDLRTSSSYSPRQIAAIERQIRAQFLRANPAYGAWLRNKTNWAKYTRNGQVYAALNSSEFSTADDMSTTGSNTAASLPYSSSPNMDPGSNLGLPRTTYNTYNAQNP